MTAAIKDRNTPRREGNLMAVGLAQDAVVFAGTLAALDSDGYAVPASDTAGLIVIGRFEESGDNTGGDDGDKVVPVMIGTYCFIGAGLGPDDVGKPCFVSDDQTIRVTANTHNIVAGIITGVDSATEAWVMTGPDASIAAAAKVDADKALARVAAAVADSVAADTAGIVANFNTLLAHLRTAGLLST